MPLREAVPVVATRYPQYIRAEYRPMAPAHEHFLDEHKTSQPIIVEDKLVGTICCVSVPGSEPLIAMQCARESGGRASSFWNFPKGHPNIGEGDIDGAVRETLEKMGIDVRDYVSAHVCARQAYTYAGFMHGDAWKRHTDYPDESKRPVCVYHKEVLYYLATLPKASTLAPQDEEVAQAAWVPLSAVKDISYPDTWALLEPLLQSQAVLSILQPSPSLSPLLLP